MPELIEIAPDQLESRLGTHKIEIIDISTTWCPPCQALKSRGFPALFAKYPEEDLVVYAIDGDEAEAKMGGDPENPLVKYNVTAYPTCIVFYNGKVINLQLDEDEEFPLGKFLGFWKEDHLLGMFEKVFDFIRLQMSQ
jgi:thiol-disulfide isomerase/thioredoxin